MRQVIESHALKREKIQKNMICSEKQKWPIHCKYYSSLLLFLKI